ncbi:acyl-CoA ligase [Microdochium bolleyi]|uniref:Acyl-CoA ligase n=1 Tax=Microdochium bolleyi TaxID=196109 RepID=A0A136JCC6_9PEZI|nr:acyl-CoA ligase [Microdochium bolleyi]
MANLSPDLQDKLNELERELEEGDITEKGFQKRRTQLLSQYGALPDATGGLRSPGAQSPDFGGQQTRGLVATNPDTNDPYSPSTITSAHGEWQPHSEAVTSPPANFEHPAGLLRPGGPLADQRPMNVHRDSLFLTPGTNYADSNDPPTRSGTMVSGDYAFKPDYQVGYDQYPQSGYDSRTDTMMDRTGTMMDAQGYFSDFAGQQSHDTPQPQFDMPQPGGDYGGGMHRYSSSDAFSPTVAIAPPMLTASDLPSSDVLEYLMPLEPREVPFAIHDPHDENTAMSSFDNIAAVLRHRGRSTAKTPAFWVLDSRGKEIASITWDKLASRAEKVAQVIRDKSSLYRGDRVALIYRDTEVIDFAIALLGCFIAGVVAVPINDLQDYHKLNLILTSTQAHLALTTDNNLKAFQRDITTQKLNWPKGVEWWKTNEFGSYHPKRKEDVPPLSVPDLAYIEFSRAPTGDLRGVVLSHRTIMHQMACLSAIVQAVPRHGPGDTFNKALRDKNGRLIGGGASSEILLSYLDPRQGIGMILGVLLNIYSGHTTVWVENKAISTPGLYAHLITKYKATLMIADYPGLRTAAFNYQQDPMTTRNFKKGMEPNFQTVKLCLIDTLIVDSEFHEVLADRWLRPLRNSRAREVVAPMLCLPEHGGMVISVRDWLGGEERMGCPLTLEVEEEDTVDSDAEEQTAAATVNGFNSLLGGGTTAAKQKDVKNDILEVLLDREALKTNEVLVVAVGDDVAKKANVDPGTVRVGAFGYPIPDATLTVVDPETGLLASPHSVGEIWVDSPSLSGGFWALRKHTEQIFHARPYKFEPGNPTPTPIEPEFLRTGLLGTVIEGKVFVLGLYEDRIRQKVEWVEHGHEIAEHRYFFVQHIVVSILRNLSKQVYDCSAFDVFVNDEHLPIVVLESTAASTAPAQSGAPPRQLDTALLDSISDKVMEVLIQEHHLRVYCVMITAPNTLPRVDKNGRRDIGNMLCRREYDAGNLPCVHVKFGVEHAVLNLPIGVDPMGGIWSHVASSSRADILGPVDKQYSGIDRREVVIDDRTSTPLNNFSSITDLIQWRVARQPDELAYCTIDGRGKEGKGITWKKFDTKVAAVALYLRNKVKIRPRDHVLLMYTHSEDFVYAVHACINLGAIVIPIAPMDERRLSEDTPAFLHLVADYGVKAVLVNHEVDHLLKVKTVQQHIKQSAAVLKINVPGIYNTSKPPKQNSGLRDLGITVDPAWVQKGYPVLIWAYWTPDQRRISVQLGHDTILGMCKVQKETCQMSSSRPVLGCVRSTTGLGFIHTCLMGIYIGTPTYLLSPVEFAQTPMSLFLTLSRYKVKDTYATPQMLDHAMNVMPGKGFNLHELKNLMITAEGRPRVDVFQKVRLHFAATGLDRTAINTVYSHVLNPMIASRSYMCIEPIELWLDQRALRRGLVIPVDSETDPKALLIQDSGMVPVSTQIAIVNPESRLLCHDGEYGEIWVDSEACVKAFYGSRDPFDAERFDGHTLDGDPNISYVRTGDLGFLHNVSRPIGPGGTQVDMQVLFVLGNIGETFEINGLSHFPMDIEASVERCHRNIVPNGCAVFQAGGLVVVLVEVSRKSYLASLVPVIVNAILNEHQIVVDIVAFVSKGDFPRSRLGEKQRGRVLAGWVSRKMRTLAQFAIRDMESDARYAALEAHRASVGSIRSSIPGASSLRNMEHAPQILEQEEMSHRMERMSMMPPPGTAVEMSAEYDDGRPSGGPPPALGIDTSVGGGGGAAREPTTGHSYELPSFGDFGDTPITANQSTPHIRLPSVDGREPYDDPSMWGGPQQQYSNGGSAAAGASRSPGGMLGSGPVGVNGQDDEEDWTRDAIMHMNLASGGGGARPTSRGN